MNTQNIKEDEEIFELTPEMIEEVKKGKEDIKAGRVVSNEEVFRKINEWLKE